MHLRKWKQDIIQYLKSFYLSSKCILIQNVLDFYTSKQSKDTKEENHFILSEWWEYGERVKQLWEILEIAIWFSALDNDLLL